MDDGYEKQHIEEPKGTEGKIKYLLLFTLLLVRSDCVVQLVGKEGENDVSLSHGSLIPIEIWTKIVEQYCKRMGVEYKEE
jgi:hypothetical protein